MKKKNCMPLYASIIPGSSPHHQSWLLSENTPCPEKSLNSIYLLYIPKHRLIKRKNPLHTQAHCRRNTYCTFSKMKAATFAFQDDRQDV